MYTANQKVECIGWSKVKKFILVSYTPRECTPLYGLYRYVQPQRVSFFSRFGHKLGIDFSHFAVILVINMVSIFAL